MPRRLRIDAPGSVHHVWSRGVEKRPLFFDDRDRWDLRERLSEILPGGGAGCLAWVFMSNHVHLVLRTGSAPLSVVVGRVLAGYATQHNKRHRRAGYLFQGRFGSRLVADAADLMGIIRYVHRNPVEAGVVGDVAAMADYRWSAHPALLGERPALPFEDVPAALRLFGEDDRAARLRLRSWMQVPDDATRDAFTALATEECRRHGILVGDVLAGRRTAPVSAVRAEICRRAAAELRMRVSEIARRLGITRSAVSLALRREAREEVDKTSRP